MMPTGWCPGTRSIPDMLALYPGTSAVRIFFGPGDGLPASAWTDQRQKLSQVPQGATVIVSHKDQGVDTRAFVDAWLAARPDVLLILVAHHEPEQQEGGDPTRAEFRASWTRQRQQVGDHPARADGRLLLAVCYTLQWIRRGGDWRTWWPDHEADVVDLVLGDWYQYMPAEPNPWRPRTYEDPASALKVLTDISAATGKPWGIAEIDHLRVTRANGFAVDLDVDGTLCAAWYRRMHAAAKAAGCRVWCHFHRDHGDLGNRLREQQALRELIEQEASMTRVKALGGHPIEQYNSPNAGGTMSGHKGLVLHIAQGTYRGTISWQMNPDQRYADGTSVTTCSTFIVGRNAGEWAQMVDADRIAWCQRSGSRDWLSVELAGYAPNPPSAWQIEACAQLLAWGHLTYGIPLQIADHPGERGLGHHSMDREWLGEEWGHDSCPGAGVIAAKGAIVARAKAIVAGEPTEDDMTTPAQFLEILADPKVAAVMRALPWQYTGGGIPTGMSALGVLNETVLKVRALVDAVGKVDDQVGAQLADEFARIEQAVAAAATADDQRDQAAAAHLAELTELVRAGQSGQLAADEVLRRMGELLTAGTQG